MWDAFIEGSYSKYRAANEPVGFEDHLYEAAKSHGTQADAVAAFSARIGVSPDAGAAYAALIVESVRRRDLGCIEPCDFLPGNAFYDEVSRLAVEPTGQLLIAVGKNLHRRALLDDNGWIALAMRHPEAQTVLEALFNYVEEVALVVAMFATTDPASWNPASIVMAADRLSDGADSWDGWLNAFIDFAERRAREAQVPMDIRAAIAQLAVSRELRLGLTANAVRRYLAHPAEIRDRLPVAVQRADTRCQPAAGYAFADDLAAALWQTGHEPEARALMRDDYAGLGPRPRRSRDRLAALSDIIASTTPDTDLFDRYFVGAKEPYPCDWPDGAGWLDAVMESPAIRPLAAARLRAAGYADMADAFESVGLYRRDETRPGALGSYARFFPDAVQSQRAQWSTIIDAVWRTTLQDATPRGPVQVKVPAETPAWPVRPLPSDIQAWKGTNEPARLPKAVSVPVDPDTILRYEGAGGEHAIVYQSSDYDMPGEVPAFGVWFMRTEHGRWMRPVYLGLRQHFPYVVTPGSALPLLKGDILQLEVQVREIDPASIIFPPIATVLRRSEDGLYLAIDVAQARADRDGDGLSDIEELTLGLDPANADSDGDGLPDGSDPLPLTAYRPDAAATDTSLARAVLDRILGHGDEAIVSGPLTDRTAGLHATTYTRTRTVFLVGDPTIFAGISVGPFRIVVYSEEDLRMLNRGPAPFYPPRIIHLLSSLDGRRHYVEWSAEWTGGRFVVTCTPGGSNCETQDLMSWVS